jgi:hypothetical protein
MGTPVLLCKGHARGYRNVASNDPVRTEQPDGGHRYVRAPAAPSVGTTVLTGKLRQQAARGHAARECNADAAAATEKRVCMFERSTDADSNRFLAAREQLKSRLRLSQQCRLERTQQQHRP